MMLATLLLSSLVVIKTSAAPDPLLNIKIDIQVNDQSADNGKDLNKVKCGIANQVEASPQRIVNGANVIVPGKYSWQVGLSRRAAPNVDYYCGGSIITKKHILTAAHCFYQFPRFDSDPPCYRDVPTTPYVGIGSNKQNETTLDILMQNVSINEYYNCSGYDNDIAIIELAEPIDFDNKGKDIFPVCLPRDTSISYAGRNATVSGWGSTVGYNPDEDKLPDYPNVLQEAQIPVLENENCIEEVAQITELTANMMCASTGEGFDGFPKGKGGCQGDSGGPLTVKDQVQEREQYVQIGVVSFGDGCASKGNPSVYARVTEFMDWIKEEVKPETIYTLP